MSSSSFVHVSTVVELHARGLAKLNASTTARSGATYTLSDEGQRELYDAMKLNAEIGRRLDAERQLDTSKEIDATQRASDWARDAFTE